MPTVTQILATGSTAATSSEFIVENGDLVTVGLKGGSGPVEFEIKDDTGAFVRAIGMGGGMSSVFTIHGPGTFRVRRGAGITCGAFISR